MIKKILHKVNGQWRCPNCDDTTIVLDAYEEEKDECTHAECANCGCAMSNKKGYKDWEEDDEMEIWW